MDLALGILLDELTMFEPKIDKAISLKTKFRNIHFLAPELLTGAAAEVAGTAQKTLYLTDTATLTQECSMALANLPANLLIIGEGAAAGIKLEVVDTLIRISGKTNREAVMQKLFDVFASYQQWDQHLLTAIIDHVAIDDFLAIAVQKLENPMALFDNAMTVMAAAGNFVKSPVINKKTRCQWKTIPLTACFLFLIKVTQRIWAASMTT